MNNPFGNLRKEIHDEDAAREREFLKVVEKYRNLNAQYESIAVTTLTWLNDASGNIGVLEIAPIRREHTYSDADWTTDLSEGAAKSWRLNFDNKYTVCIYYYTDYDPERHHYDYSKAPITGFGVARCSYRNGREAKKRYS